MTPHSPSSFPESLLSSPRRVRRRSRSLTIRIGSGLIAVAMAMLLVGQTTAAAISPLEAGSVVRQVTSYEQDFNPYGDPWASKMGQNGSIPVGLTPACHRLGQKAENTTPN